MIVDILKELIKIDTRSSIFNETEAALYLKDICEKQKIECEVVEPVEGKGSFIAHIPGKDKNKGELLLLSHLDTAEFGDLKSWRYHPCDPVEFKGRIFGRGAIDCKGLVSLWLSVITDIKKNNLQPDRGIIFVAAADEENGGEYGMKHLLKNRLIQDCSYVIGEGGGFPIKLGGTTYYTCQNAEVGYNSNNTKGHEKREQANKHLGNALINLLKGLYISKIYNFELVKFLISQSFSKKQKRRLDTYPIFYGFPSDYSSVSTDLYNIITKETINTFPHSAVIPFTTPGYSDNRYLRGLGKIVYGYFPLSLEDYPSGVHGYNENINISGLLNSYELMKKIVAKFCFK